MKTKKTYLAKHLLLVTKMMDMTNIIELTAWCSLLKFSKIKAFLSNKLCRISSEPYQLMKHYSLKNRREKTHSWIWDLLLTKHLLFLTGISIISNLIASIIEGLHFPWKIFSTTTNTSTILLKDKVFMTNSLLIWRLTLLIKCTIPR